MCMLFLIVALPVEARPLIQHYNLKKEMASHPFPLYRRDDIYLIISGVGQVRSAMAATWLQAWVKPADRQVSWINFGFCGTNEPQADIGQLVQAGKITDVTTDRDYYPDLQAGRELTTVVLHCHPRPVIAAQVSQDQPIWCDMESSGFMEATGRFAMANRILVLKLVSDHLGPVPMSRPALQALVEQQLPVLQQLLVGTTLPWQDPVDPIWPPSVLPLIQQLVRQHHYSVSMQQLLHRTVHRTVAAGRDPTVLLSSALQADATDKKEGKKLFAALMQKLHE